MRKNESGGRDRPKARQQEFVGFQFLRARQRLATSDAMPPSVDELESLLRPPFGDSHDPRAVLDETAVGARPDTDKGFDSPTPSRKRLGISLLLIPIFLVVLFLSTSIDQSTDNAGTASQNRTVSYTAVQVPPQTEIQAEPNALEQLGAPELERGTADELRRELATARRELEKARAQAVAAQAVAEQQRQLATLERKENAALREDVDALRKDLDALKSSGMREENLRRELVVANHHLADLQRINADVGRQRALTAIAVEDQTTKAAELTGDLVLAQRELQRVRAQAKAAHKATEVSLATKVDALEEERRKVGLAERDLAATRQSIEQLEASAQLASKKQADLLQSVQLAEAAAKQAGEALERERERASALAHDLKSAHRERIVTQQELERVLVASKQAVDQEREKAGALTRDLASARKDLASARKDIDALMRRASRRVTKATAVADVSRRPALRRSEPKAQLPKAITLPNALRPTRPPLEGSLR